MSQNLENAGGDEGEEGDEGELDYLELDDDEEYEAYEKDELEAQQETDGRYEIHPDGYRIYRLESDDVDAAETSEQELPTRNVSGRNSRSDGGDSRRNSNCNSGSSGSSSSSNCNDGRSSTSSNNKRSSSSGTSSSRGSVSRNSDNGSSDSRRNSDSRTNNGSGSSNAARSSSSVGSYAKSFFSFAFPFLASSSSSCSPSSSSKAATQSTTTSTTATPNTSASDTETSPNTPLVTIHTSVPELTTSLSSSPEPTELSHTTPDSISLPDGTATSATSAITTTATVPSTDLPAPDTIAASTVAAVSTTNATTSNPTASDETLASTSTPVISTPANTEEEKKVNVKAKCTDGLTLQYCCDTVEYVPLWQDVKEAESDQKESVQNAGVFACGNYELISQSDQKKVGRILLYHDDQGQLKELFRLDTPAVFDLKWAWGQQPLLAAAYADGGMEVFEMKNHALHRVAFDHSSSHPTTSVCWNNQFAQQQQQDLEQKQDSQQPANTDANSNDDGNDDDSDGHASNVSSSGLKLASSYANGNIAFWQFTNDSLLVPINTWKAHDAEVWVVTFNQWQPLLAYSGADDCKFKLWDLRIGSTSVMSSGKHSMGVCTIQTHPSFEHIVATGSYDETLMIWDDRNWRQPLLQHQLGGGVWRVKWHPRDPTLLAAACMHNGFHVVKLPQDFNSKSSIETQNSFYHESLAYGVDWNPNVTESRLAACSFYDRLLKLWQVDLSLAANSSG